MHTIAIQEILEILKYNQGQAPTIPRAAYSGGVMATGENACVLAHNGELMPLIAISYYGKGRVVVAGAKEYQDPQTHHGRYSQVAGLLKSWLTTGATDPLALQQIRHIDRKLTQEDGQALLEFVYGGGSVFACERGWDMLDVLEPHVAKVIGDRNPRLSDYPLQQFLGSVGLGLLDAIAQWDDDTTKPLPLLSIEGSRALGLNYLTRHLATLDRASDLDPSLFTGTLQKPISAENLGLMLASAVSSSPTQAPWLMTLQREYGQDLTCHTLEDPDTAPLLRMLQGRAFNDIKLSTTAIASPLAADYPGRVARGGLPVSKQFDIPLEIPDHTYLQMYSPPGLWHSTGLYADAGCPLGVWYFGESDQVEIQIGCHSDNNSGLGKWDRAPVICHRQTLKAGFNSIASVFGGLVYLIPTGRGQAQNQAQAQVGPTYGHVRIDNGYPAPYYRLGDSDTQWLADIASATAPWAEIETDRLVLTVPTDTAKALKSPSLLAKAWDAMINAYDNFVGLSPKGPLPHKSPTGKYRMVADRQIVAGWMHAGYPIMLFEGITAIDMLTVEGISQVKKAWGFWHELGHNYQQRSWVWEAVVEVTVNIYSLYMQDQSPNTSRLITEKAYEGAFAFMSAPGEGKCYHDDNQIGYFERLVLYRQLETAFGWTLFTALHKTYRQRQDLFDIVDEQEKIDTFVAIVCELTGENLLPFFQRWAFNVSEAAQQSILGKHFKPQRADYTTYKSPKDYVI